VVQCVVSTFAALALASSATSLLQLPNSMMETAAAAIKNMFLFIVLSFY